MRNPIAASKNLRFAVAASNALTWISSAIVVGITGYFLNNYQRDLHLTYQIIIAAIVLALWLPSAILPILKGYRFYYAPLNFIFSYLWLTAFIFAAEDYNRSNCALNAPFGGSCSLKLTNEAFIFLAFFFSFLATILDTYAWKNTAVAAAEPVHPEKPATAPAATAPDNTV